MNNEILTTGNQDGTKNECEVEDQIKYKQRSSRTKIRNLILN